MNFLLHNRAALIPSLMPCAQWSIKLHAGSSEALQQYKVNLTAIAVHLERLADHGEVYWVLQGEMSAPPRGPPSR